MTDLSVVIVTYNASQYIEDCLSSLIPELDGLDSEIFIIDNASDDGTLDIARKSIEDHNSDGIALNLIENEANRGYAPANNQGLSLATGRWLLTMNPDAFIQPGSIRSLIGALEAMPEAAAVGPQMRFPDGRIQKSCRQFPSYGGVIMEVLGLAYLFRKNDFFNRWKMGGFDHTYAREVDQPMGAALLVRKEAMDDVGMLDEQFVMFFNDVDWCKRFKDKGWKIIFHPDAVVHHLLGASIKTAKSRMILQEHVGFYLYFGKHFRKFSQRPMNQFMGLILFGTALARIFYHMLRGLVRR